MALNPDIEQIFKGMDILADEPLSRYTSFRVGGPAQALARPSTPEELAALVKTARRANLAVTILGGGTNTLVSDAGIQGLVIVLTRMKSGVVQDKAQTGDSPGIVRIRALAGERLATVCRFASDHGLSGLEWAAGIPGTLGGAVVMNAGAHGSEIKDRVICLKVLDLATLELTSLAREELDFCYRGLGLDNAVVVAADLAMTMGDPQAIQASAAQNLTRKKASQPISRASGGCFFKNPSPDQPAGWLIEQAGLKGARIGGAVVSDLHANFIINQGNASCADILALKARIQDDVFKKFKVRLTAEVKAIGTTQAFRADAGTKNQGAS